MVASLCRGRPLILTLASPRFPPGHCLAWLAFARLALPRLPQLVAPRCIHGQPCWHGLIHLMRCIDFKY